MKPDSNKNDNGNITNDSKDGRSKNNVTTMLLIMTNNDDNHKNAIGNVINC
jgi:hypothetical protein